MAGEILCGDSSMKDAVVSVSPATLTCSLVAFRRKKEFCKTPW